MAIELGLTALSVTDHYTLESMIPESEGLVFKAPNGGPVRRSNSRHRVWSPATTSVGISGVRFHDLRHTHASWLIEQGVHAKVISTRLGHSSIRVTMDRYGHLLPGLDDRVGDILEEMTASKHHLRVVS